VARLFRVWEKKRGQRQTGSQLVGSVGEATFFGALFLLGLVPLIAVFASLLLETSWPIFNDSQFAFWLVIIVLISFLVIGGSGVSFTVFRVGTSVERRSSLAKRAAGMEIISEAMPSAKEFPNVPRDANITNSPGVQLQYRLPMAHSPAWRLAAVTTFCVVWNAISTILLSKTTQAQFTGERSFFLTIFTIPFVAIGLWAIYQFFCQLWQQTSIGPTSVEISSHPLVPNGKYEFYLSQAGHMTLNHYQVRLACEELASYNQGTDTRTESRFVYEKCLFEDADFMIKPGEPFVHECELRIPADAIHSFQANNNRIQWRLIVTGNADDWPPFERQFPIVVYPQLPRVDKLLAEEGHDGSAD
jgi:hypothetical protein